MAAKIPGPVSDNPFPVGQLSFWANKDTFGKDEVQDVINTSGGKWPKVFWLVVEGFSKNSFNIFGVTIPAPTGPFTSLTGIRVSQNPDIDFENAANPQSPQRIRVPFDLTFTNTALAYNFAGVAAPSMTVTSTTTFYPRCYCLREVILLSSTTKCIESTPKDSFIGMKI